MDELAERRKEKQIAADVSACIDALKSSKIIHPDDIDWGEGESDHGN